MPLNDPSRRRFLRGLGALIALPTFERTLAESAKAAAASGAVTGGSPLRLAFIYTPNGAIMNHWTPQGTGSDFTLPEILSPLGKVKSRIQVISGLKHDKGKANGDGGGDHARAVASFLTATQARKTAGNDIRLGISIDQLAASQLGVETPLPSLELGCDQAVKAGNCDSGYSCAYQFNFSWKNETMPLPPEHDPRLVFEKLFGSVSESPAHRQRRLAQRRSVLDFVLEDANALQSSLGYHDQQKLEEYLTGVREAEAKIQRSEKFSATFDGGRRPEGVPSDYTEHIRLMYDMMVLAFQSDSTRVATFLVAHDGSNRTFPHLGVPDNHHGISHHRKDPEKLAKLVKVGKYYTEQFAYFVGKMAATREADGSSLLDHSALVFGGGMSDPDAHSHEDLPIILAGGGNGTLHPGRHVVTNQPVPMANLYLSLLDRAGVKAERFGDSTGRFEQI